MEINDSVQKRHEEMTGWRRELHSRPELAFQEKWTSDFVAEKLESFGLPIHRGLAGTGVVATLKNGEGPSIGLRADIDALPLLEKNKFGHRSQNEGKCMPAGMTGTRRCCLEPHRFWPNLQVSGVRFISSSNLPKKEAAVEM